jgi:alkaline phosphatase D
MIDDPCGRVLTRKAGVMVNRVKVGVPVLVLCLASALCQAEQPAVEPNDAVTLRDAHKGNLEVDTRLLDSFGRLPANRRNFYLAARQILADSPDATPADPRIVALAQQAELPLMSGPMLGDLSAHGLTVWFRPVHPGTVTVQVAGPNGERKAFGVKVTRPGQVHRAELTELQPDTAYTYRLISESDNELASGSFHTARPPATPGVCRIAFGSCFHKIGVHNPNLMRQIVQRGNRAMLLLGDLAVDDREAEANMHHADYLLRDASAPWRTFSANIPVYASWDDHDYLNNDKAGLQLGRITEEQRNTLRQLWQDSWNNPPAEVEDRGIYFSAMIGDIQVIMLDTRSCRDRKKRGELGAYLGEAQMKWLLETLKQSQAKFIILTSGTMWTDFISNGKDSWGTWDKEGREQIFRFIEENNLAVLLLSGDRHGARGFKFERPSGATFYEFQVASLGGVRGPGAFGPNRSVQLFGYGRKIKAFGEFTFDTTQADPQVTFRLIGEDGTELEQHTIRRSQLTPPKAGAPGVDEAATTD